jgi:hypothetical protein
LCRAGSGPWVGSLRSLVRLSWVQSGGVIGLGWVRLGHRVWSGWVGSSLVGSTTRMAMANLVRERVALVRVGWFVIK